MDASREGELLFQRGRLREEERLGMKVRASIQVVRRGGGAGLSQPSGQALLAPKGKGKKKKAESERDCLNRWEARDRRLKSESLLWPHLGYLLDCWKSLDGWDPAPPLYPTRPLLVVPENEARGMEPLSSPFIKTWWAAPGSIEF